MKPAPLSKKDKIKQTFYKIFLGDTAPKKIILFYIYTIILGVILLSLPISLEHSSTYEKVVGIDENGNLIKQKYTFLDILFTTVSAFSDTGLTTAVSSKTFSWFGEFVILCLVQIGGFGLFTIYWCFWNLIFNSKLYKKRHNIDPYSTVNMSFSQNFLLYSERGSTKLGLTTKTIKIGVIFILSVELIFWIFYSGFFALTPAYEAVEVQTLLPNGTNDSLNSLYVATDKQVSFYHNPQAIWVGLFHSISSINNAGFDILGTSSLAPYRNGLGTILQFATMIQIILGGLGFPVIYEIITKIRCKIKGQKYSLSVFSKLSLIAYFSFLSIGIILLFSFELSLETGIFKTIQNAPNEYEQYVKDYFGSEQNITSRNWNIFSNLLFNVVSSRNAGFSTMSQLSLSIPSKWTIMSLMFIGCSPSSNGGGIKGITVIILVLLLISRIRGLKETTAFKRRIPKQTVIDCLIVITLGFFIVLASSLIFIGFWEKDIDFTNMLFEVISIFSTTGLSSGALSQIAAKPNAAFTFFVIVMCIVMLIGQAGISTLLSSFKKDVTKSNAVSYPIAEIKI